MSRVISLDSLEQQRSTMNKILYYHNRVKKLINTNGEKRKWVNKFTIAHHTNTIFDRRKILRCGKLTSIKGFVTAINQFCSARIRSSDREIFPHAGTALLSIIVSSEYAFNKGQLYKATMNSQRLP